MMKKALLAILLVVMTPFFAADHINFWQKFFTDPVERIYIIMKDGTPFKHSNQEERFIHLSAGILEETLKKKLYKIKDIAIIIHNHRIE